MLKYLYQLTDDPAPDLTDIVPTSEPASGDLKKVTWQNVKTLIGGGLGLRVGTTGVLSGVLQDVKDANAVNSGLKLSTTNAEYTGIFAFASKTANTLIYLNASKEVTSLAAGTNGDVLTLAGGLPTWAAASGGSGITIGTTAITSGTAGRLLFESATNKVSQSSSLFWDITNSRLGIGTSTPATTLQVVGNMTLSGTTAQILTATVDGSDNKELVISSANAVGITRGAFFALEGNEVASLGGSILFGCGDNANGRIGMYTAAFIERMRVCYNGGISIGSTYVATDAGSGNLIVSGTVGIGTTSATAKLHVISTTEQLRVGYDNTYYFSTTVGGTGGVTFDAFGAGASFTFSDKVIFSSTARLFGYTVATLPAGVLGDTAYVNDALAPAYGVIVAGGGAITVPVFFNGVNWITA